MWPFREKFKVNSSRRFSIMCKRVQFFLSSENIWNAAFEICLLSHMWLCAIEAIYFLFLVYICIKWQKRNIGVKRRVIWHRTSEVEHLFVRGRAHKAVEVDMPHPLDDHWRHLVRSGSSNPVSALDCKTSSQLFIWVAKRRPSIRGIR